MAFAEIIKYKETTINHHKHLTLLDNPERFDLVQDKFLNHRCSSEEISGRLKLEKSNLNIRYNTIYRDKFRHPKDYIEKRGKIPISNHIVDRPEIANNRE